MDESKKSDVILEIENISLNNLQILTCRGCRICFEISEYKCPLKDDVQLIYKKMKQADGIILGSPIYVEDVNGLMKNWIDRMAFNCHRPFLAGKPVMILLTSGGGASKHALRTISSAIYAWGGTISGNKIFRMGRLMNLEEMELKFNEIARRQSLKLLKSLYQREPTMYSLMGFTIQQKYWRTNKYNKDSVDYLYWKDNGWLKKNCFYYKNNIMNYPKLLLAKIIGNIVGLFFIKK
jgi:multimeric flavodoxin WrbA